MAKKSEASAKTLESRVARLEAELELLHEMYHNLAREFGRIPKEILVVPGNQKSLH